MGISFLITGRGGAGKTTVAANLGTALAKRGKRVILLDASLGLRGLDLPLGVENQVVSTIFDVIRGRERAEDVLLSCPTSEHLRLMPASQTKTAADLEPEQLNALVEELKELCDYVLIDAPAGIDWGFALAVSAAERAILVTDTARSSVRTADRLSSLLKAAGRREIHLFWNRIRTEAIEEKSHLSIPEAEDLLGLPVIGLVPESRAITAASETGISLWEKNPGKAVAFSQAASRLLGEELPIELPRAKSGFLKWLSGT